MFRVYSIEEAQALMTSHFPHWIQPIETLAILDACERILGEDCFSSENIPSFDRSTVDGLAIMSKDTFGVSESIPSPFKRISRVQMGHPCTESIQSGLSIYVPTGGMLPKNADSVVMIEDTETLGDMDFVTKKMAPKENILFTGEDIAKGEKILSKGHKLRPQDIGILAAMGKKTVKVYKMLSFTVISTGDELVPLDADPQLGEVRDINSYTIMAELKRRLMNVTHFEVIQDDKDLLLKAMEEGLTRSDILVISGGSSVGDGDLTVSLIESLQSESVFVHGLAIKPGKPTILAKVNDKLVIGLPGQPTSCLTVLNLLLDHIETLFLNQEPIPHPYHEAILMQNVACTKGRDTFVMVRLQTDHGKLLAHPLFGKSGAISSLSKADGYFIIPKDIEGFLKGKNIPIFTLGGN